MGDRIKSLRVKSEMSQEELAKTIKSTKQTIYKYENNIITNIPQNKIVLIAKALNTTPAFLMGWEEQNTILTEKDNRDIAKKMDSILKELDDSEGLMFDGEILDDETKELLKASLENSLKMGKIIAKQKFTPKKYKK